MPLTLRQMLDLPPIWLVLAIALAWALGGLGPVMDLPGQRMLAVIFLAAGLVLIALALAAFRRHRTTIVPHQTPERLISSGIYGRTRNPIYLADLLILAGVIIWMGAVLALLLVPGLAWVLTERFIKPEEDRMNRKFGTEFNKYAQVTPRWL